jgi:peptide/nickel transport system permease protein
MRRYALRRIFLGIITVIIVSMIIFIAARLSGDVAILLAPNDSTDEEIQAIRIELGLDKPIPYQYFLFAKNAIRGDFGQSIRYNRPAMEVLFSRFSGTVELVGTAVCNETRHMA